MAPKPVLLDKAIEITKAYAQSGAVKDPSFISECLQQTYDKLVTLNEESHK